MSKIYCSECGTPMQYGSKKPNFCINCGHPLNKAAATAKHNFSLDEEVEESIEEPLDIQEGFELDVEYGEEARSKGFKLGDISDSLSEDSSLAKGGTSKSKRRGRPPKQDNEKVWKQFRDDAGGTPAKENFDG